MTASDQVTRTSKSPHSNGAVDKTPSGSRASLRSSLPQLAAINPEPGLWYSSDTLASSGKRYLVPDDVSDGRQHFGADENAERGNWTGQLDFLLSCIGYAVGLGNVWRFPYLCYRNGGGAFFVPYIIMLSFIGMPLFFMELSLGQFSSNGPLTCWGFSPLFKGLGVAQLVISAIVSIYYNMIIAWSLYYFFASFTSSLPWADCSHWWNTDNCSLKLPDAQCDEPSLHKYVNGTCYNSTTFIGLWNYTLFRNKTGISRHSPSEEYYNHRVLNISPTGISDMGPVQWELALCLLGAWIIAFLCMIKGIKSSGKVVYFTAIFPYVVLVILFVRGVSLPNAWNGIYFYIVPKWEKLGDAKVWNDAAVQIFFSLSDCWGGLIALSSYNRFHNNVLRDTIIVSMGNCLTSVFAGVVIFSFIGFMAGEMNAEVENVVDKGPGLAFIVYPDAVSRMVVAPLWAILFFTMLITLGLDSQFTMLETVLTSLMDQFKAVRRHKTKLTLATCVVFFLLGLPLCTRGGPYLLQLMDSYAGGWSLLIIGLLECTAIAWVYGSQRFRLDISIMMGKTPSLWWELCWKFFSPLLIVFVLAFAWIDYSPARYGDYYFPAWADAMGWLMTFASITWIPVMAIYLLCREDGPLRERLKLLTSPTTEWGPALVKYRKLVDYVPRFVTDPWGTGTKKEPIDYDNMAVDSRNNRRIGGVLPVYGTPSTSRGSMSNVGDQSLNSQLSYSNVSFESSV